MPVILMTPIGLLCSFVPLDVLSNIILDLILGKGGDGDVLKEGKQGCLMKKKDPFLTKTGFGSEWRCGVRMGRIVEMK